MIFDFEWILGNVLCVVKGNSGTEPASAQTTEATVQSIQVKFLISRIHFLIPIPLWGTTFFQIPPSRYNSFSQSHLKSAILY